MITATRVVEDNSARRIAELVLLVRQNNEAAAEALCLRLLRGIRLLLRRRLGPQDFEDTAQDVMLDVITAIRQDKIRDPEAVAAFARSVAMRKSAAHIGKLITHRARHIGSADDLSTVAHSMCALPEQAHLEAERVDIARRALSRLKPREQEILRRFYVEEHSAEQICRDMNLTATQFRLTKSRAKAKFGEFGRSLQMKRNSTLSHRTCPVSAHNRDCSKSVAQGRADYSPPSA